MRDPSDGRLMRDPTATDDPSMAERESSRGYLGRLIREFWRGLPFSALLFVFWIVLSGKFDGSHLLAGATCAMAVSLWTGRLLRLPPQLGLSASHPLAGVFWLRFPMYLLWLARQVVTANLHVAWIVLHPRMPIQPSLVRLDKPAPHTFARLVLANSITLTPGTVTLDVDTTGYLVHALTSRSAANLRSGDTVRRCQALFLHTDPESGQGGTR